MNEGVVEAGLVAGDARVDLVGRSALGLVHPVGIGEHRPGHRNQLCVTAVEDLFGSLGHVDPIRGGYRNVDVLLEFAGDVDEGCSGNRGDDGGHP